MKVLQLVIGTVLLIGLQAPVNAEGFYIGGGAGAGDIDIAENTFPGITSETTNSNGVLVADALLGYELDSGIFFNLGFEGYDTFDFIVPTDSIKLKTVRTSIGYTIPGDSSWKFFGKGGLSFWQLEVTESAFLNPGPEFTGKVSGEDFFAQIGLEYRFEKIRWGLSYDYSNNKFGESTAGKLNLKYAF